MPNYNPVRMDLLEQTYTQKLREAVEADPNQYPWYPDKFTVEDVAGRMMRQVREVGINAVSITGHAWENSRKEIGLKKRSYAAWSEWLNAAD
jgi:hypothetical protein